LLKHHYGATPVQRRTVNAWRPC